MEIINGVERPEKENQNITLEGSEFYQYKILTSPVGPLTLLANSRALLRLDWGADIPKLPPQQGFVANAENSEILSQTQAQLSEYFVELEPTLRYHLLLWELTFKFELGSNSSQSPTVTWQLMVSRQAAWAAPSHLVRLVPLMERILLALLSLVTESLAHQGILRDLQVVLR